MKKIKLPMRDEMAYRIELLSKEYDRPQVEIIRRLIRRGLWFVDDLKAHGYRDQSL